MFRLIKLAFYGLIGYALYELYVGMTSGSSQSGASQRRGSRNWERAMSGDQGRMGTLTGPGMGERQATLDSDGGSATHSVGRGVIRT